MLFSKLLLPTLKEAPQEAEVVSHKLMLRAGMIRKVASGIYTWLPLGLKVLKKVENIVQLVRDTKSQVMVGFNRRFDPHFAKLKLHLIQKLTNNIKKIFFSA